MTAGESEFLETLAESERTHFRHLAMVRPQLPTEGQVHMLEGLARSLASPRLLALMARTGWPTGPFCSDWQKTRPRPKASAATWRWWSRSSTR